MKSSRKPCHCISSLRWAWFVHYPAKAWNLEASTAADENDDDDVRELCNTMEDQRTLRCAARWMCVQSRKWFRHRRMMHFHLVISTLQSNWSLELSSFIFYSDRMFLNREYTSTWCQLRCSSSIVPFIHTLFWRAISASLHFSPGRQLLQHWNAGELKKHRAIERTTMSPLEHVKCRWWYVNFKVEARQPFLISFVAQRLLHQKPSPFPPASIFLVPFLPWSRATTSLKLITTHTYTGTTAAVL